MWSEAGVIEIGQASVLAPSVNARSRIGKTISTAEWAAKSGLSGLSGVPRSRSRQGQRSGVVGIGFGADAGKLFRHFEQQDRSCLIVETPLERVLNNDSNAQHQPGGNATTSAEQATKDRKTKFIA